MIRYFVLIIIVASAFGCKKPYGQDPLITESFPDSLTYPQITEIEDNDDPFQFYRLARIHYSRGEVNEAIEYAREAIALDDDNALYYNLLAELLAKEGKTNEALENALKSYSLGFVNPDLQVLIAQLYYEAGNISEGQQYLDIAIRKRPNDPEITFLRARIFLQHNDSLNAITWTNKSLELDSSFVKAYRQKAEIMMAWDSIGKAIDNYKQIYRIDSQDRENIYTIATLELQRNNLEEAKKWLHRLLKQDNSYVAAYLQLAQVFLSQREYDSVQYYASVALEHNEDFNDARLLLARSYDRQYRYTQALDIYREIVARDSTFDIAIIEMEVLEKKIAYLRRMREQQDSARLMEPAPLEIIENSDSQND